MGKRTLTPDEKTAILAHERKAHPDAIVTVDDETDGFGMPVVHRHTEGAVARKQEPHGA